MTRSQRMEPVKRLADDKADVAAKALAEAQRRLEEQQRRQEQLQEFRGQYQTQRARSGETGIDGFRLRDYNAFVGRIDEAIAQQRQAVAQAEAEVARLHQQWTELLGRARAIDKVVDRYQQDERRDQERRDQRQSDALAQARFRLPKDES
jgi:flagellar FliJ protein